MKRGRGKAHLLKVARKIIEKKGYSSTHIIEVAREANISVGTLYYHFPRGKIDILIAIFKNITANYVKEAEKLGYSPNKQFSSLEEALRFHLGIIVKLHKKYRITFTAWENEILPNLENIIKLRDEKDLAGILKGEMDLLFEQIRHIIKQFPKENITIEGKVEQLYFILQAIIHKYSLNDSIFISEEKFIDLISKITLIILKE